MAYSDEDLLRIVGEERKRSIGFGEGDGGELTAAREKALAYYKGEMRDVPAMANRSKAVDTTVADAIETVLPDVMEIFVGGDDIATFIPQSEEDEERAQEETDFVTHVVMVENEGFLNIYTAFKDALLTRTGILHWWWEENEKAETKHQIPPEMADAAPMLQAIASQNGEQLESEEQEDGSVNLNASTLHGKVCIKAYPPEDFTVAADTVSLRDATYCAVRDRPRVQSLIERGIDAEKARALPSYSLRNDTVEQERDYAGEHDTPQDGTTGDLRIVEVRAHYIRLAMEEGGPLEVWCVVTDTEERVLLHKEKVDQIPFAALTPYIVAHRFYGESVADKLIEVQKIKTALWRMLLDSGYFALNQRMEVAMSQANEFTIADLLNNQPNIPVRSTSGQAVRPLTAGGLNFDAFQALEFASTMAESRSGIVRNAQGLNPDTLHDTASGAMALISAAQKRVRMIARIFAETGIKDMFLGVHRMLRLNTTDDHAPASAKLRNSWKQVQPNGWPERCAMTIHVGVGSAGKEHDLAVANQRLEIMNGLVMQQGGVSGPLVDANNVHNALGAWERAAGSKAADKFWSDPANAPPQPPKPDPAMVKVQSEAQLAQAKAQTEAQLTAQKTQVDAQAAEAKAQRDHELNLAQVNSNAALAKYKTDQELQLKRETNAAELQLKRELLTAELEMKRQEIVLNANMKQQTDAGGVSEVEPGGQPG